MNLHQRIKGYYLKINYNSNYLRLGSFKIIIFAKKNREKITKYHKMTLKYPKWDIWGSFWGILEKTNIFHYRNSPFFNRIRQERKTKSFKEKILVFLKNIH
jgi:hypothetical protein